MILDTPGRPHLSYCTNIHPGETWEEVRASLGEHLPAVRSRLGAAGPFGVGLRLSAPAARGLSEPAAMEEFRDFLLRGDFYVFTINGFPYGEFHSGRVKEKVYEPDWRDGRRVAYHDLLARLLADLLPEGGEGSVSTVPGGFRESVRDDGDAALIARNGARHAAKLAAIYEETGRLVTINLEPEPFCFIETVAEAADFLPRVFAWEGNEEFRRITGMSAAQAEETLRRHVGVCVDVCHLAVQFEDAQEAAKQLRAEGIKIGKAQISAALAAESPGAAEIEALAPFAEGRYLHQTTRKGAGGLQRYLDLPQALAAWRRDRLPSEWRIHFHVPIHLENLGPFRGTRETLLPFLDMVRREEVTPHLEIETYTWHVLPPEHRGETVDEDIARELAFVLKRLSA